MNIGPDTRWFQDRLADQRMSQRKLASMMNLDPAAVSLMLRGKRKASAAEVADIANLLGVSADDVLLHLGSTPTMPARRAERVSEPLVTGQEWKAVATTPAPVVGPPNVGMIELPVPMADGTTAKLLLPRALSNGDAERISALVRALAVP